MNNGKSIAQAAKAPSATAVPPSSTVPANSQPAPLFRRVDWLTLLVTFAVVWIGYYLTLAPEQTLEDSGELATGSFYAAIPHPPGYPLWSIYTWLWTVLLPVKNIAWRVALAEATGGAMAAGLLSLLVSRGSSLLMEGIEELKDMTGRWESAICMVSGFVAGMMLGYNGYFWSQSVIVEVYAFSVASLMVVMLCLLRWIYAPKQRRYLYLALFVHGICFTNHQTLIVAALGIEVAIAAANFRLGRCLFLGNSIIYLCGWILEQEHILTALEQNRAIFTMFHIVGWLSIAAYVWFAILTKETFAELCLDASEAALFLLLCSIPGLGIFCLVLALGALAACIKFSIDTWKLGNEWVVVLLLGLCWIAGAGFYFYMPLAGMTNPPMEWGYPRELGGFIHAFTRGQYEKTNPSDIIGHPLNFLIQLQGMGTGIVDEFNWVCTFLALIPFLFFLKMHRRERAWMIGVTAIYLCLGVLLLILLNPSTDRAARDLNKVFFTASHTLVSLLLGYGLTLIAAYMATHYQRFRSWGLIGGAVGLALAIYSFVELTQSTYFGETAPYNSSSFWSLVGQTFTNPNQYGVPVFAGVILIGIVVVFLCSLLLYRNRAPLGITLLLFALLPVHSILTHWSDNEQRDHWYGYWFGHDMFTPPFKATDGKPLYPDMTKDTVLFGGTDPGRFCPTYMIFCDSFLPTNCRPVFDKKFDRRDVYIITQNALADGTYLEYIRAQFNRSAQIDQPFFRELFRFALNDKDYQTNILARMAAPLDTFFTGLGDRIEKKRRTFTSWFTENEFTDAPALATKLRPSPQQDPLSKYLYENLSKETQQIVGQSADPKALGRALAKDFNVLLERELVIRKLKTEKEDEKAALDEDLATGTVSESKRQRQTELAKEIAELSRTGPLYEPDRFKGVQLSEYVTDFIKQNPQSHTRIRLNRLLLEEAYPKEIVHSIGGVYPDREIYTPSPEDSQKCFNDYLQDAQRRLQMNPPALKPGEDVHIVDNRVQVSGQVAVMAINGLLTKVIFDHNPKNEFYVEESFPLDWMYPYLTPFGIIMKINRQQLPELSDEICKRDHEFWKQYSTRLCGDIIDYDTPVKRIADFIEKVYLHRDYTGFTGDRKFVRDDQAQKAFSKLRSSIGGIYQWRIDKSQNPAAQQRMIKEADFAFRQAFAYCPYSPEAVFRYVNLLLSPYMNRLDDALIIAETCLKLDPYNGQVQDLVKRLKQYRAQMPAQAPQAQAQQFAAMEKAVQDNPSNYQAIFNLAAAYMQVQQRDRALQVLDRVLNDPHADAPALRTLIEVYSQIGERPKIQAAVTQFEAELKTNSGNFPVALALAEGYRQLQEPDKAGQALDQVLANPQVDSNEVLVVAQSFAQMGNMPKLEASLTKLVAVAPDSPEAWYDLAALSAQLGKNQDAVSDLRRALDLSAKRHKLNPKARDLVAEAQKDNRFASLHELPEYEKLVPSK